MRLSDYIIEAVEEKIQQQLARVAIPEGMDFADLHLARDAAGNVSFDWGVIERICAASGLPVELLRDGPEDNVAGLLIAGLFYVAKSIQITQGLDESNVDWVTQGIFGGATWLERARTAVSNLGVYRWLFLWLLPAFVFVRPPIRWLMGVLIVPFTLVWAFFFSYDTRNLALVLPSTPGSDKESRCGAALLPARPPVLESLVAFVDDPPPYPEPERLMIAGIQQPGDDSEYHPFGDADFLAGIDSVQ